ncbi:hypothetical protein NUM3379_34680 [Kineococcus sp. NUM-3379]
MDDRWSLRVEEVRMPGGMGPRPRPQPGESEWAEWVEARQREELARRARRFCWVQGGPEAPGPWAGMVIAWQRDPGSGWRAEVVYLVDDVTPAVVVCTWVEARNLRPA